MKGFPKKAESYEEDINGYHVFGQSIQYQYERKVLLDEQYLHIVDSEYPILAYTSSVGEIGMIDESFYRSGDNGAFQGLFSKTKLKKLQIMFVLSILKSEFKKFRYDTSMTDTMLINFKLPSTSDGQPDWAYMEEYMKQIMKKSENSIENLEKADDKKHLIDVNDWGKFKISDLFEVLKGSRLTKADKKQGNVNFVSTSIFNNGVIDKIGNNEHIHPSNTMVVVYDGHATGRTYYQYEPYWASDSVNVLYPKFNLTEKIGLYLIPIFETVGKDFVYTDKWTQEKMQSSIIYLPITSTGEPDWQYMENYMRDIMTKSENAINNLTRCDS